jgi:heptosyltransferase II
LPTAMNFVECNLSIAALLDADTSSSSVECYFDEVDERDVHSLIGESITRPLIAVHPSSNWQSKTWYAERWALVADTLMTNHGATVIFVGTEAERAYIDSIRSAMTAATLCVAGKTTLSQLAALLSQCDLFIGTDSGPRHIAAGAGIPQVTVMSSQDRPERWDFRRQQETVLRTDPTCSPCFQSYCAHRRCMSEIGVAQVLTASDQLLGRYRVSDVSRSVH